MDAASQDIELTREQDRLFNFLKKYDLQQYYSKFLLKGVHRLTHLKGVLADEASLDEIGLSRIERMRLRKKVKENVAWKGKIVKKLTGKDKRFNTRAPEMASVTSSEARKEGRRTAAIIPKDEVALVRKIGEGAHGSVHEGTWADVHGAVAVAVKTLYVKQDAEQFIKEANSMATLHHKHIIQLFGVVLAQPLMLVEELAPFGSLHGYIKKEGAHVTLPLLHTYACQIADAMAYLENRRLVHRDLAIRNILLAQVDYVKLSDFGMARLLDENSEVYNLSNLATRIPIAWTAPEAMLHAQFSSASDVWSYGVSLWEIYSVGNIPWKGLGPVEIRDLLMEGQRLGRPARCPADMFDLIQACWKENPQKRPTFADILKRVKILVPRQVRAVKAHVLGDDPSAISFRTGDVIYVIDKPSRDWYSGMKMDGTIGHLRSDFVSELISPLDDIKAKVAAGRAVEDVTIGSPTHVDHMVHYFHDGSKWVSENANDRDDPTPPNSPPHLTKDIRRSSESSANSLPFTVINARSPSPKVTSPKSPLVSSMKTGSSSHYPLPYQLPISTLVNPRPPTAEASSQSPNLHQQVSRSESAPPSRGEPVSSTRGVLLLGDIGNIDHNLASTPDADNQYVSIKRTSFISPTPKRSPTQQDQMDSRRTDPELMDAYVSMQSWSVTRSTSAAEQNSSGSESRSASVTEWEDLGVPHTDSERTRSASSAACNLLPNFPKQRSQSMVGPSYVNYPTISAPSQATPSSSLFGLPSSMTSSHYDEPRSISTGHYQIPRSIADSSQTATAPPTSNATSPASDTSPQSLLDTSNPTSSGADLPTPLVPTPSPTKSTSRRLGNSQTLPSRSSRKQSDDDVFLDWEKEAVVPQSTRSLYPSAGAGASALEAWMAPPIPKPRTGLAIAERGGGRSRESEGAVNRDRPQVPQRRHLLSNSEMENDYQPLNLETLSSAVPSEYVVLDPKAVLVGSHGRGVMAVNGSGQGVNPVNGGRVAKRNEHTMNGNRRGVNVVNSSSAAPNGIRGRNGGVSPLEGLDKDDILDEILHDEEFSGFEVEICRFALEQQNYDLEYAKEEMRVQILLSMLLPHIREEDCRRALVHCQQKTNRAAAWLIQRSEELERRAQ